VEPSTIAEVLRCNAHRWAERPAIVAIGAPPLSYRELLEHIERIRDGLGQAGFSSGCRIVVALPNGPLAALATVAVACSAVAVPLDTKLAVPEVDKRLTLVRPSAVVVPEGGDTPARTVAQRRGISIIELAPRNAGRLDLTMAIPRVGPAACLDEPSPDAPAFILQTSGTTGEPKLIPYSHRNMLAAAARVQGWFGLTPNDRCLSVSPLYYSHGIKVTVFIPLITGGSIAFPLDASRLEMAEWFGALAPTWYSAAPTLHRYVLDKAMLLPDAAKAHHLRFIVSGGAPLPRGVATGLQEALGVPVLEHYGASEAAQISANLPAPGPTRLGTCGVPPKGILMIAREDGSQAAPGERGEVRVRGPTVMMGYLYAPELNRAVFVDGWFRTGDIGSLDEDGFLTLYGREKELINRGGEKIAPAEIDEALMRHPAVLEAAAYAVQHPRLGEDIAAAVVLRPGVVVSPDDLRAFLATQLAWFKIPRRIVFRNELPKGLTGKVQRRKLDRARNDIDASPSGRGLPAR
jgi:acyl-CoA synthetase (AMP-forming)/AMP-acid ligase II